MDQAIKHCTAGLGSGSGRATTRAASPMWSWPAAATCRRWRRWRQSISFASIAPELKVRVVNVVDLMKLQPASEHPHGLSGPRFRRAVHHGQADHLRLPRLPVADPPADLPADTSRQSPCARLQGGRHDDHAVRHVRAERSRPLPPGRRRDRPRCRSSARARRTSSRRSATSSSSTSSTSLGTATTCRKSRAGPGGSRERRKGHARRRRITSEPGRSRTVEAFVTLLRFRP